MAPPMTELHNISRTGKVRVWRIGADGDQVITEFGELGGKFQRVVDTAIAVNVGKSNYRSPELVAQDMVERQIELKTREGYLPPSEKRDEEFTWDVLPESLRFYKPDNDLSAKLEKLLEKGDAFLARKRDGDMMVWVVNDERQVQAYSRTMLRCHDKEPGVPWEVRYPHVAQEIANMDLPPRTILLGEMVPPSEKDDFKYVSRVVKSLSEKSLALQQEQGFLQFYIWDIAFFGGEPMCRTRPVRDRYDLIFELVNLDSDALLPVEVLGSGDFLGCEEPKDSPTYNAAKGPVWNCVAATAYENGWEGFVVVDPNGVYGDKAFNLRGKVDRPGAACGKLKPTFSDDFIAVWNPGLGDGSYGTGKYQKLVGSVQLYQLDSNGILVPISEVGNGFTEADLRALSDEDIYPAVFVVEYDSRTYISEGADTNALRFPRFLCARTDKHISECVNPRL
jgi:ATP-dependent DNA ligase